jgi:hypothetical protein
MSAPGSHLASEEYFERGLSRVLAEGFAVSQAQGARGLFRKVLGALVLLAFLVVVLVHEPAYARGTKARAPLGLPSGGAHDRRGTSSMGHEENSADALTTEDELELAIVEIRAAARAADRSRLREAFRRAEATLPPAGVTEDEARWLAFLAQETDPVHRRVLERFANYRNQWGQRTTIRYSPHPTEGPGMLAARIAEDEARVPWFPPHEDVTEEDFLNGRQLVGEVVEAFTQGNRHLLSRMSDALSALRGDDAQNLERMLGLIAFLEIEIARWRKGEPLEASHDEEIGRIQRTMAENFDPLLGQVGARFLSSALDEAAQNVRGAVATAAEISLRAKALDSWEEGTTHDDLVARFKKRVEKWRARSRQKVNA